LGVNDSLALEFSDPFSVSILVTQRNFAVQRCGSATEFSEANSDLISDLVTKTLLTLRCYYVKTFTAKHR
jgi:hypothetical protein